MPRAVATLAAWLSIQLAAHGAPAGLEEPLRPWLAVTAADADATPSEDFVMPTAWFEQPLSAMPDAQAEEVEIATWPEHDGDSADSLIELTTAQGEWIEELPPHTPLEENYVFDEWSWQWLPTGLIYRSYLAGVHEPRAAIVAFHEGKDRTLWDATLGGRFGIVRCGDCDPLRPQGFQLDFYGAAISRLDVENQQDLDSTDYVFGVPLTYGVGDWQFKFGYAHLSSHLGDELAIRDPSTLPERVNYVRDAIVFGTSYFVHPVWRQYGEVGWAFHNSGGAQPWEAQFGTELSLPGPTGRAGTPFFAVNGRMREEHDFGGDLTVQAGWLRRGGFGQTMRIGAHYYNGKSSQFQFFDETEEQLGVGLWYDF